MSAVEVLAGYLSTYVITDGAERVHAERLLNELGQHGLIVTEQRKGAEQRVPDAALPVDLGEIQEGLAEITAAIVKVGGEDVETSTMLTVASMQISLSLAIDTRRQAEASERSADALAFTSQELRALRDIARRS